MSLRDALYAIKTIEESIVLSSTLTSAMKVDARNYGRIKKVFLLDPPKSQNLVDLPCFMNLALPQDEARMGNFREDHATVQIDFYGPDIDKGQELAVAFYDVAWAAFDAERPSARRLGGTVDYLNLRGDGSAVPASQDWNGLFFPGWRLLLDLTMFETVVPV